MYLSFTSVSLRTCSIFSGLFVFPIDTSEIRKEEKQSSLEAGHNNSVSSTRLNSVCATRTSRLAHEVQQRESQCYCESEFPELLCGPEGFMQTQPLPPRGASSSYQQCYC